MTKRAFRPIAIMLSLLIAASVPAQASPVTLSDVVQMISGNPRYGGQAPTMQLRYSAQEDKTQQSSSVASSKAPSTSSQQSGEVSTSPQQQGSTTQQTQTQAQTEEVGEIEVGDCECGELPDEIVEIPGKRSFLPFIPLIGLVCVTGICTPDNNPTPTPPVLPTPTPPTTPVPEPATIFLFGSSLVALGAGARRRYARSKLAQHANITEG